MALRMIRYGMCAGFGFLLAMTIVEWWLHARPEASGVRPGAGAAGDVSDQVWAVLAEARRITEEAL
jgi:hypothetical protein